MSPPMSLPMPLKSLRLHPTLHPPFRSRTKLSRQQPPRTATATATRRATLVSSGIPSASTQLHLSHLRLPHLFAHYSLLLLLGYVLLLLLLLLGLAVMLGLLRTALLLLLLCALRRGPARVETARDGGVRP